MKGICEKLNKVLRRNKCYSECGFYCASVSKKKTSNLVILKTDTSYKDRLTIHIKNGTVCNQYDCKNIIGVSPMLKKLCRLYKSGDIALHVYLYKLKPTNKRRYISQYYLEEIYEGANLS